MTNPYAPPQAVVHDIADPLEGTVLADRGIRLGAAILDGLIFGGMVYLPLGIGAVAGGALQQAAASDSSDNMAGFGIGMLVGLVGFGAWLAITVKFMMANGQSIGKKACGIKVVRRDGSVASLSRLILLRNVLNGLIGLIPLYGLIDVLFIFNEQRRCVHDYLADTIVIKA